MKDYAIFEYTKNDGLLSRISPLPKLSGMVIICIVTAILPIPAIIVPAGLIVFLILNSGLGVLRQFGAMWKLFIFFIFSGVIRIFTTDSVIDGILFSVRLIIMSGTGILFYSSTRLSRLRSSLEKIFSFIPFLCDRRLAELLVMALAFLPIIFKTISEQKQARYSRAYNSTRRPHRSILRTLKLTSIPLMIEMFLKTDEMADAWYSRS